MFGQLTTDMSNISCLQLEENQLNQQQTNFIVGLSENPTSSYQEDDPFLFWLFSRKAR